jgi:hypothetical protein
MAPHETYIETHLGGGAIMQRKPSSLGSIGIDRNQRALERFRARTRWSWCTAARTGVLADYDYRGRESIE